MEETILQQLTVAGFAFVFGILNGIVCDAITILRCTVCLSSGLPEKPDRFFDKEWPLIGKPVRRTRSGHLENWWLLCSDLVFWTLLTLGSVLFLFFFYDGRFRWFFALAAALGFALYRISVSRLVIGFFRYLLFFLQLFFRYLLHFVKIPFIIVAIKVSKGVKWVWQSLRRVGFLLFRKTVLRCLTNRTEAHFDRILRDIT